MIKIKHLFMLHDIKEHHDFAKKVEKVMQDYDYELIYNTSVTAARRYIEHCENPSRFYIVGGDGTLQQLLQSFVYTKHTVVVLPMGTGNDFCHAMTNEKNSIQLLKQSLSLEPQVVDTILMNHTYYINAACFGLDQVIASTVHDVQPIPLVPKSKAYILSILRNVLKYKKQYVEISNENEILYQGKVTLCTVNNAIYYGGGFPITPQALLQDGYMDICVVDDVPLHKYPHLISLLLQRKLSQRKEVHYFKEKELFVKCDGACNVDGEKYEDNTYHFVMQPQSLSLIVYEKS